MHMTNFLLATLLLVETIKLPFILDTNNNLIAIRNHVFKTYLNTLKYVF